MDAGLDLVCIISESHSPLANQFFWLSTLSDKGKKLINNVKKNIFMSFAGGLKS